MLENTCFLLYRQERSSPFCVFLNILHFVFFWEGLSSNTVAWKTGLSNPYFKLEVIPGTLSVCAVSRTWSPKYDLCCWILVPYPECSTTNSEHLQFVLL